jgi:hydrogenase maturation protease
MTGERTTPCRALVAGFGRPGMRDLDFGRQVVAWLQQLDWPDGVVVEDLSFSAPLVLDRLQELRPAKVVLVGAVARHLDPPGTLRRYRVDLTPPAPHEVHRSIEESVMGQVDLDHTLAIARHWGGLPTDTVVIEVEPAEACFGLGFSEVLAGALDPILDLVRDELTGVSGDEETGVEADGLLAPATDLVDLLGYAEDHARSRLQSHRAPALVETPACAVPGVALAGRVRPWGVFTDSGSDWFDAIPLPGGALGVVLGDVAGRGVEAAAAMGDLRAAVRAYAVLDGGSPGDLLGRLDLLAEATGLGCQAQLLYLTVQPATGEVRYANAGGCPPLVLAGDDGQFEKGTCGPPLGAGGGATRREGTLRLDPGDTVLMFTDGLVESRVVSRGTGLERLRLAATDGPLDLDALCSHVIGACTGRLRRDDDICLVGLRLCAAPMWSPASPSSASSSWPR